MKEPRTLLKLEYDTIVDSPSGPRPWWVWTLLGVYALFAAAIVLAPEWMRLLIGDDASFFIFLSVTSSVLTLCGLGLIVARVRIARRRPIARRHIWIPILCSGCLLAILVLGIGMAIEAVVSGDEAPLLGSMAGAGIAWIFWMITLGLLSSRMEPSSLLVRMHRCIYVGSAAELLVAVPAHIIVRQRNECCAGVITGTAICIGAVVMIVAMGPAAVMLYFRRWQQIRPTPRTPGQP